MTIASDAYARAQASPARFVGVYLASPSGQWTTQPLRSLAELADWFADWRGNPGLWTYLAIFDKGSRAWAMQIPEASASGAGMAQFQAPTSRIDSAPHMDEPSGFLGSLGDMLGSAYDGLVASVSGARGGKGQSAMTTNKVGHGGHGGGGFHGGGHWGSGRQRPLYPRGWGGYWSSPWAGYPYVVYEMPAEIEQVPVVICDPATDPDCAAFGPSDTGDDGQAVAVVSGDLTITVSHAGERLAGIACAGLFDSITSAVSSAVHGVTDVAQSAAGTITHTLGQLRGPIAAAASMAAAGAAAGIPGAGPLVAPLAGSLAKNLVDAATGGGDVKAASQKVIHQATQQAARNPQVAAALATAQNAVTRATAGYHVVQTAANAAAGNADAAAQIAELHDIAAQGDSGALQLVSWAQDVASPMQNQASPGTTRDPNWQVDPYAIEMDAPATAAGFVRLGAGAVATPRQLAIAAAQEFPAQVVGIVQLASGSWQLQGFQSSDDADDWYGQWLGLPHAFRYVAYFDRNDATFPGPLNEAHGKPLGARIASAGALLPLFALGAGAAGGYFGPGAYQWAKARWSPKA